jgi:hypothetical protein
LVTRKFDADPTVAVDEFKVGELRALLMYKGVSVEECQSLKKPALVKRVGQVMGSAMQRVGRALSYRTTRAQSLSQSASASAPKHAFVQFGTDILVHLTSYLGLGELAHFASVDGFLRARLTLSLNGTPSPGLASLKRLNFSYAHAKAFADAKSKASSRSTGAGTGTGAKTVAASRTNAQVHYDALLAKICSRILALQSLQTSVCTGGAKGGRFPLLSLPASLKHVDISGLAIRVKLFETLSKCTLLESLSLAFNGGNGGQILSQSLPDIKWPCLRSLRMSDLAASPYLFRDMSVAVPALEKLCLLNLGTHTPEFATRLACLPHLKTLHLHCVYDDEEGHTTLQLESLTSLTALSIGGSRITYPDMSTFPSSLTALRCSLYSFWDNKAAAAHLPHLRSLILCSSDLDIPTFRRVVKLVSVFPCLSRLGVELERGTNTVLSATAFGAIARWLCGKSPVAARLTHFSFAGHVCLAKVTLIAYKRHVEQIRQRRPDLALTLAFTFNESTDAEIASEWNSSTHFPPLPSEECGLTCEGKCGIQHEGSSAPRSAP